MIQFLILEGFIKERSIPKINLFKRDFSNFNDDKFRKEVNQINWDVIVKLDLKDPNLSLNNFYTNLTFLLDEFAPYKKVSNKECRLNFKPWISTEILNLMKQRDKLLKNFSQENDPTKKTTLHTAYKQLRNLVTQKKRLSKSLYYTSYFEKNSEKSSAIWKGIRNLVNVKSSNKTHFKLLDNDNKLISDQKKLLINLTIILLMWVSTLINKFLEQMEILETT